MSKNQQAPGELEHVRAFVNTRDLEEGVEELSDPGALASWLRSRGLAGGDLVARSADLERALELREALRAVLLAHNGPGGRPPVDASAILDDAVCRARVRMRFNEDGVALLEPQAAGVSGALGRLLVIIQESIAAG